MQPSPRIMRWGSFALGMLLTLGIFFAFGDRRQWLSASVSDALIPNDTHTIAPDLIAHSEDNALTISAARTFPAHDAQSFRADILYNPLVFTSSDQITITSAFLLSSTMEDGILSILLAPHDADSIASGTILTSMTFDIPTDIRDLPILESVSRYDPSQTESLHIAYQ